MAANDEVGSLVVRLGLDSMGFQDGISRINAAMRVVQTELQAATAAFANAGSATDVLGAKAESLSKQIELQSQAVNLLQQAVAKSAAEKGEDARQTDLLTAKLNRYQAQLSQMQAQLESTNTQIAEHNSGLATIGDTVSNLSRSMEVVQSEFRAATAALGSDASATDQLRLKLDSLNKEYQLQAQMVKELASAYQASIDQKGKDAEATQQLAIQYNDAQARLSQLRASISETNTTLQQENSWLAQVRQALGLNSSAAEEASRSYNSLGSILKQAFLYSGVYAGLYAITNGIKDAISAGVQWDAQMQQMQVGFTTILGSAQVAQQMLEQLTAFAQSTPFSTTQVEQSAQQMLAMGFAAQQILPAMKAIGDAAAALGLTSDGIQRVSLALGQMLAHGTVDAQDMLQLTEAGIPAWQMLAQSMGKTVPQLQSMVSKGLVPAKQATDALLADMEARYPNMLQKMNTSFSSEMGNLGDAAKHTFGDLIKPEFDWLTNTALPAINAKLDTFRQTLEQAGASAAFKTILPSSVVDGFNALGDAVKSVFNFISQNGPLVASILEGIAAGLAFAGTVVAVEKVVAAFSTLVTVVRTTIAAVAAMDIAMDANPIGALAVAIGAVVTALTLLTKAWNNDWGGIQEKTQAVIGVIVAVFNNMVDLLKGGWYAIEVAGIAAFQVILDAVSPLVNLIGKIAPGAASAFKSFQDSVNDARKNAVQNLNNDLIQTTNSVYAIAQAAANVKDAFSTWSTPTKPGAAGAAVQMGDGSLALQTPHGSTASEAATQSASVSTAATNAALQAAIASAQKQATAATMSAKSTATQSAEDIVQSFIDGINSKLAPLQNTIDQLKARLQFRQDQGNSAAVTETINEEIAAYQKQADAVRNAMSAISKEIGKLDPKKQASDIANLRNQYSQLATEWWNDKDAITQLNNQLKQTSQDAAQAASDAFKTMTDSEISDIQTALQNELNAMQQAHQQALSDFDAVTQAMDAQFQAQIAALQQQSTENDRANQQAQWDSQMGDLQHQLAVANLMGDTSTIDQVKQQIDQLNQEISQQKQQWAIQDQEQTIQQQQQAYDQQRALQRQALDQQLTAIENEKQQEIQLQEQAFQTLQSQLVAAIQAGQLTQAQAQAAWVQAIKDTGDQSLQAQITAQQNVQTELQKWADQYTAVGKKYGTNLGSGLVSGLNSMLKAVQSAAAQLANAAAAAMSVGQSTVASATISIPKMAAGGVLTGPTTVLAGEAGPEAILPLNDSTLSKLARAIMAQAPGRGTGNITVPVYLDGKQIAGYVLDIATGQLLEQQRKGA
ncbi:MAG: tape measure protein [Alicyclobacillus sp.]|nr:tape measure protein [Alicyclobacillus sp.]